MPPSIICRTFLGCLPLRSGICVLAITALMLGGFGAAGSWIEVAMSETHPLQTLDVIALFSQAIAFSLLGVLALIGLLAGITNKRGVTNAFSKMVVFHLILTIGVVAFVMYSSFRSVSDLVVFNCISGDSDEVVVEFCNKGFNLVKAVPIFFFGTTILIHIYTYIIAINLTEKLELDEAVRWSGSYTKFGPLDGDYGRAV